MSDFQSLKDDISNTIRKIFNNPYFIDSPWFDFESQLGVRRRDLNLKFRVGYSNCGAAIIKGTRTIAHLGIKCTARGVEFKKTDVVESAAHIGDSIHSKCSKCSTRNINCLILEIYIA